MANEAEQRLEQAARIRRLEAEEERTMARTQWEAMKGGTPIGDGYYVMGNEGLICLLDPMQSLPTAKLLAASPELLAALKAAVEVIQFHSGAYEHDEPDGLWSAMKSWSVDARAAIAKAE